MKNYFRYIILGFSIVNLACNDWLNIQPKAETSQDVIFSTPDGYESALMGVYSLLTEPSLYSSNLTMGTMDIIGQYYDISPKVGYSFTDIQKLDYKSPVLTSFFNSVWSCFYEAIANCNVLIEELEKSGKTVLLPHRFHIIKGEAYSLRAFLHLELNRMFAARYVDGTEKSIPYVEQFDMQISKHLSQEEVMAKIIKDFQIGIAELKEGDDPAISGNLGLDMDESETIDFFMSSRSERLNYYAAYALLARAYMWKGDRDNALVAIDTVLNTKNYPKYPTNEWTFSAPNNEDLLVSSEIIFRLRDEKILKSYEWFTKIEQNNYSGFLALKSIEEYFIDGGDYRKIHSIKTNNSEMYPYSIKYKKGDDYSVGRRIPVIRVAELLYYKAEILYDKQPQEAIRILDDFQKTRGIAVEVDKSVNKKDFIKLITQDARREFIGEGQFFLFNKRLGQNLYYGKKEIQMEDFWIFPKPDGELEFIQSK